MSNNDLDTSLEYILRMLGSEIVKNSLLQDRVEELERHIVDFVQQVEKEAAVDATQEG